MAWKNFVIRFLLKNHGFSVLEFSSRASSYLGRCLWTDFGLLLLRDQTVREIRVVVASIVIIASDAHRWKGQTKLKKLLEEHHPPHWKSRAPEFSLPNLLYWVNGDHPEEDGAIFNLYMKINEVEHFRHPSIFLTTLFERLTMLSDYYYYYYYY